MKRTDADDEIANLRKRFRQSVDLATQSVADMLCCVMDLLIATSNRKAADVARPDATTPAETMNREEAAAYIGVKASTLAGWANCGTYRNELPFSKVGKRAMYRKTDLDAFLASKFEQPRKR